MLHDFIEFITIRDDLQATDLSQTSLVGIDTSAIYLLPGIDVVRFTSSLHSTIVIANLHKSRSEPRISEDLSETKLGSVVETLRETILTHLRDLGEIGSADKLLEASQVTSLGEGIGQFGLDLLFLDLLGEDEV